MECALWCEAANMALVDDETVRTHPRPRTVVPLVGVRVDDLRRAVRTLGLAPGVWVRERAVVIDAITVPHAGADPRHERVPRLAAVAHHREQHVADGHVDPAGERRPDTE